MKIAYLSDSPLRSCVANAVHVMNMCSAFAANGHDTVLYACGSPRLRPSAEIFSIYGVPDEFELALRPKIRVKLVGRICYAWLQALRAKAGAGTAIYYARCVVSAAFILMLGGSVVLEVHELPRTALERRAQRFVLRHRGLRRLVVISKALLEDLAAVHAGILDKVDCVVAPDGANAGSPGEAFPLERGPGRQLGYAGGLRAGNGIGTLLELAAGLPHDTFHVLGGTADEIAYWKRMQRTTNVVWYERSTPARVHGFLRACDVLLAPYVPGPKTNSGCDTSRWMSPLKIFEYMAAGRPLIVADFPVLREVVTEDFAVLAEPENLAAWMRALQRLEDDRLRARLGNAARSALESRYSWNARARLVLEGLDETPAPKVREEGAEQLPAQSTPGSL